MFSCEFCESFKNTFFTEHLRVTAFVYCVMKLVRLQARTGIFSEGDQLFTSTSLNRCHMKVSISIPDTATKIQ